MSEVKGQGSTPSRRKRRRANGRTTNRRTSGGFSSGITKGAAAAERASAGMGTADLEPTDWLFGDTLNKTAA
jgi:hypothetical protein